MYDNYKKWLENENLDPELKKELLTIKGDEKEIGARFSSPMRFGTAGLRSVIGAGISRMNIYTVAQTTKALAETVKARGGAEKGVAIAYDSRNKSELFAQTAASVLASSGVKVYLFDGLRPTPELSFAVLYYGCKAGINITASHNTKEYNGYKVYWEDGAQLPPEQAKEISDKTAETDIFAEYAGGDIIMIGSETDDAFLTEVARCRIMPEKTEEFGNGLNIIYTPLHGAGYRLVPRALEAAGISNLRIVGSQAVPDGNFPTVASPNPENRECFELAARIAENGGPDCGLIIATDPDGDRLGVCVKNGAGVFTALNGNQIGALLTDYIITALKIKNRLPENACVIKSVVSGGLSDAICEKHGVRHTEVLTGFKYIGEKIKEFLISGSDSFIFGYEESQGYLSGSYVRDKDAVAASLLITEAASYYKSLGKTLYQRLGELYSEYGYFRETAISFSVPGAEPMERMAEKMAELRSDPPKSLSGCRIIKTDDFLYPEKTGMPESDMLIFTTSDSSKIIIRPSGTEPKIKAYILVKRENESSAAEAVKNLSAAVRALI